MNFNPKVQNNTDALANAILEDRDEFLSWKERIAKKSMAEVWKKLGITDTKASKNDYAMLSIGPEKGGNMQCKRPISGINALADIAKYRVLDWHKHIAWFDPTLDAEDVVVYWNESSNRYEFFSWTNGAFVPSILMLPVLTSKRLQNKRKNMLGKHAELDRYCQAKRFGNRYTIVMSDTEVLHHYEAEVRKYMEEPYSVYLQRQIDRWNEVKAVQQVNNPSPRYNPVKPPASAKVALADVLANATADVVLKIITGTSVNPRFEWFHPANEEAKNRQISGILKSPSTTSVAVATDEEIKAARIIIG